MSRTKNNKLLTPLIVSNDHKLKQVYEVKPSKEIKRKKDLLKVYQNQSPLLPKRFLKKDIKNTNISVIDASITNVIRNNRYDKKQLHQYLEEAKIPEQGHPSFRRTARKRPQSLFKIPQKSSVIQIRTRREKPIGNQENSEMNQNHSVDLFKIKQSRQKKTKDFVSQSSNLMISKAKIYFQNGKRCYKQGKLQEAERFFNDSLKQDSTMLQNYYFLSIIMLNRKQFEQAIQILKKIINAKKDYKKSVYLFICIALKNISKNQQAILIASQGIKIYPDYFDLVLYRAKLYQLDKILDMAEKDYDLAISLKQDSAEAYFKKAQCLIIMKQYKKAINTLTTALYLDQGYKLRVLQQRARVYLETLMLNEAKKDIQKLLSLDNSCSDNYELKGYLQTKEGLIHDAILSFEQCIKNNTSKISLSNALVEITKFKIKDRDFYSAYHHICRSEFLQLSTPSVEMYKLFTQGVIFLMKRKTKEGLDNLNKVEAKYPFMDEYLIKLFYLYRAYGYFVSSDHELCIKDYASAEKFNKKDRHGVYNMLLAEGIVKCKNYQFDQGFSYFNQAQELLPNKIQPFLYRAVTYVLLGCKLHQEDQIKKLENVFLGLKQLDKAYDVNNSNSNLLFLRCLVYYYLGKINEGLEDIGRAISKSEQNVPKYFFYRGLGNGTLKNYKQAQNDFTICINLDQNFEQAYLERAKTFFLQHQISKAIEDLRKYVQFKPKQNIHLLQGNLFFSSGEIEEALKRYEVALDTKQILIMKAKSYIVINEYKKAIQILKKLNKMSSEEYEIDLAIAKLLQILETQNPEKDKIQEIIQVLQNPRICKIPIFGQQHVYHYLGVSLFYLQKYDEAMIQFNKAYKERQILNIQLEMDDRDLKNILNSEESQQDEYYEKEFNQINYNIFLCHLMNGQIKKAYELFIRDILPAKENVFQNESLAEFSHMIFQVLKKTEQSQNQRILEITLFDNSLSNSLAPVDIDLKSGKVRTKLCLLLPSLKLKDTNPEISSKNIIKRIGLCEVENRPQPPWVKRNMEENLIFTDDIQEMENIEFNTEENQEEEEEEEEDQEQEQEYSQEEEQSEQEDKKRNIDKIRQAMRLDDSIEKKLNKILNKRNK